MARNVRVVTGPAYAPQDRAEAFADALTARALRSRAPQQGGPVQVAMNPWEGVAQLGEAGIAALLSRKSIKLAEADQQRKLAANDAMIRQLANEKAPRRMNEQGQSVGAPVEMPTDLDNRPMMLSDKAEQLSAAMAGLDPTQGNQVLSGAVLQKALAGPAALKEVDLGDRIGLMDESGQIVRELPKRATPDTALREQGSDRRHATASGSTVLSERGAMARHAMPSGSAQLANQGAMDRHNTASGSAQLAAQTAQAAQAAKAGMPSTANPLGLNDRQVSGMNTQVNAVLNYAANLTGMPREQIDAVLAAEGPAGITKLVKEKGGRFVQGRTAMAIKALPFVGDAIVNMANPDTVAPVAAGAAGVAAYNNPAGMITNSDVMMGERQMPQPQYPLETQAQIIEQILQQGAAAKGGPQGAPQPPVTATGPNGEKIALVNGQWVPVNGQ